MRLRWLVVTTVGLALLLVAVVFAVALSVDERERWLFILMPVCAMLVVGAPASVGLLIASYTFDVDSRAGRRAVRRTVLVASGLQVLGVVGLVVIAVAAPEATAVLVGILVLSVAMLVISVRLGMRVQRRIVDDWANDHVWSPWTPQVVRAKGRRVVIVFAVVSVVGIAGMVGLEFAFGDVGDSPLAGVAYGASFGLLAAAIACMVVAWPLLQDCRRVLGRDYATQKAILRVVVRNRNDELTEDGRRRAATYAAIMARYLPFQHGQLVLLMSSVWLQQLWNLTDRLSSGIRPLTVALVIGYPALLAVLLPISIRRTFRVKRYAADNADLVTSRFVDLEPPTSG